MFASMKAYQRHQLSVSFVQPRRLLGIDHAQSMVDQPGRLGEGCQHLYEGLRLPGKRLQFRMAFPMHGGELVKQRAHRRIGLRYRKQQQVKGVRDPSRFTGVAGGYIGNVVSRLFHDTPLAVALNQGPDKKLTLLPGSKRAQNHAIS